MTAKIESAVNAGDLVADLVGACLDAHRDGIPPDLLTPRLIGMIEARDEQIRDKAWKEAQERYQQSSFEAGKVEGLKLALDAVTKSDSVVIVAAEIRAEIERRGGKD